MRLPHLHAISARATDPRGSGLGKSTPRAQSVGGGLVCRMARTLKSPVVGLLSNFMWSFNSQSQARPRCPAAGHELVRLMSFCSY